MTLSMEAKLAEFARWVLENSSFSGCDLDGADAEAKAAELGIIVPCKRRPDWWVYSGEVSDIARDGEGLNR